MNSSIRSFSYLFLSFLTFSLNSFGQAARDVLPPLLPWDGKSQTLIAKPSNPWITVTEKSDFRFSPSYEETMEWLEKLSGSSAFLKMVTIGESESNRNINMVIATKDKDFSAEALAKSTKPLILFQAGIHSGEIDGKDAGMMLLRDIVHGSKQALLEEVNLLFIPILNVDGHERSSAFNRVNQRGPELQGWRTNARNLNLNRDYAKLETKGIQAVVAVINKYEPDLYLDIHVTDGVDYQYDITYGFSGAHAYSPQISKWLSTVFSPPVDRDLEAMGHIPGPLIFTVNNIDFEDGYLAFDSSPRYSDGYGSARHLPTILVENHSLKPFKQRLLGTYVFLEAAIKAVSKNRATLKKAIENDKISRKEAIPLTFKLQESTPDTLVLKGIASRRIISEVTGDTLVEWLGKPVTQHVPVVTYNMPDVFVKRPKAYWIPAAYSDIIEKLKTHGIEMEILETPRTVAVEMYRINDAELASKPFEGRVQVSGQPVPEEHQEQFAPGSARVPTDQPLGILATLLLEPGHPDSFFQWGYFLEIMERTEYVEPYFMEPYAKQLLDRDPKLRSAFEEKLQSDSAFRENPGAILAWFYKNSPYYDARYLLYPIGREQ